MMWEIYLIYGILFTYLFGLLVYWILKARGLIREEDAKLRAIEFEMRLMAMAERLGVPYYQIAEDKKRLISVLRKMGLWRDYD